MKSAFLVERSEQRVSATRSSFLRSPHCSLASLCSLALPARELAAHQLRQLARNAQPDAETLALRGRVARLRPHPEDALLLVLRHARPGVSDGKLDLGHARVVTKQIRAEYDRARLRELGSVADQVEQHQVELGGVLEREEKREEAPPVGEEKREEAPPVALNSERHGAF